MLKRADGVKLKIVLAAILGSLLFGVAVSEAAASEVEWRQGGVKLTEAIGTKWKGTVKLTDAAAEGAGHPATLQCEEGAEGLAGPGAVDEATNSKMSASCTLSGLTRCESHSFAVERVNLPWHSELTAAEGDVYDVITAVGKGSPGYRIKCTVAGEIEKVVDECTGTLKTADRNSTGGVSATYDGEELTCEHPKSTYGASKATLEGSVLIEAAKGATLEADLAGTWRQGGSALTEPVAAKSAGTIKLTDEGASGGALKVECGQSTEGSVGAHAADEQSTFSASSCAQVSGTVCEKGHPVTLVPLHLPWRSEVIVGNESTRDVIVESGKGAPGYAIKCTVAGIFEIVDECTGTLQTAMTNVTGGVDASFDGEKLKCTLGGSGKGLVEGGQLVEATKGAKLEVTDAAPVWALGGTLLGSSESATWKGTVEVTDESGPGGRLAVECEGSGEGSIGAWASGEQTKWSASHCTIVSAAECETGRTAKISPVDLPWRSELAVSAGAVVDVIGSGGKGAPGYAIECTVAGILETVDECTGTLETSMTNVTGGVDSAADEKLRCTVGGSGKGLAQGTQLIEAAKGGKLEVMR